jgi:2-desacetyl-2-hydroxyethyl bacteriochlorophyllide A dehydrogenase
MESTYIVFTGKGKVEVKKEAVDVENLAANEVVIKNETSIISAGTELARLHEVEGKTEFPLRPGYGAIGRIIAKGEGIKDYKTGDRVFYAGTHSSVQRFMHTDNSQWEHIFPVPADMDPVKAAVGCMAEIAMTAPNATDIKMGDTVAVFGLGMVGILAAQMFQLLGAKVIGVDPVKERCECAKKAGIQTVVDVEPARQAETILALTGGKGTEVAVDAVGHSAVIMNCIKCAALFGQVILVGTPRASYTVDITPVFTDVHRREITIRGAHMYRYPLKTQRGVPMSAEWAFGQVFDLIDKGKLKVENLISHVIRPDEAAKAYDGLQNNKNEYTCVIMDWRD